MARIKRPFGISRLQQELEAVSNRLAWQFPNTNAGLSFRAESFRDIYSGDVRPYLLVMLGAVAFVLLIACVNVVNLLLSRALARDREIAVRTSLGASRWNLIGQLLTESTVLSISAAGFGLVLAYWLVKALRAMIGLELPSWMVIEIDLPVLAFTAGMAVIAGIAAALETILGKLLPGVSGFDPWSAAPCLLVLIAVTLAASAVPAWRISRLDPAVTLRQD